MSEDQPESERSPPKIVQAGLTQDELDRLPSNFLNTTSLIGSRATFIAGFSYYSVSFLLLLLVVILVLMILLVWTDWKIPIFLLCQ